MTVTLKAHGIIRLEPAGAKTWRTVCACGWEGPAQEKRNLAAIDGVRHCNPEPKQETS